MNNIPRSNRIRIKSYMEGTKEIIKVYAPNGEEINGVVEIEYHADVGGYGSVKLTLVDAEIDIEAFVESIKDINIHTIEE